MKAGIHPKTITAVATCANCGKVYKLIGHYHSEKITIEQCSACHQAYTGVKAKQAQGAGEAFYSKFKFNINGLGTKKKS